MEQKINRQKFSGNAEVRFAKKTDIPAIMKFIEQYWSATHILAHDRQIFEFQYVYGDEVCFVLSIEKQSGEIEGVLGYIPYAVQGERDIFTALWKVRKGKNLFQGMELLYYLEENAGCRNLYCAGINESTFSIYKYMKKDISKLSHYYMLNPEGEYKIAVIQEKKFLTAEPREADVTAVTSYAQFHERFRESDYTTFPQKSREYIKRRYFEHPEYQYQIFSVQQESGNGWLFAREQYCNGKKILRIMDYIGTDEGFISFGTFLQTKLVNEPYEYIDIMQFGMSEQNMKRAGFALVRENDVNIIPNYFEPFVRENVTVHIFYPRDTSVRMFKGDGDQDRPNMRSR